MSEPFHVFTYSMYRLAMSFSCAPAQEMLAELLVDESLLWSLHYNYPDWFRRKYEADHRTLINGDTYYMKELHETCIKAARCLYRLGSPVAISINHGLHSFQKLYAANLGDAVVEVIYECTHCGQRDYDEYQNGELVHSNVPLYCTK